MEKYRYFVYILRCADDSYYTGVTNDLERRIYEHQSGNNPESYTHTRRPLKLTFCTEFDQVNDAIAFEKQIKGWSRKKKEALIDGNWAALKPLAECLNSTSHKNCSKASFDHPAARSAHSNKFKISKNEL